MIRKSCFKKSIKWSCTGKYLEGIFFVFLSSCVSCLGLFSWWSSKNVTERNTGLFNNMDFTQPWSYHSEMLNCWRMNIIFWHFFCCKVSRWTLWKRVFSMKKRFSCEKGSIRCKNHSGWYSARPEPLLNKSMSFLTSRKLFSIVWRMHYSKSIFHERKAIALHFATRWHKGCDPKHAFLKEKKNQWHILSTECILDWVIVFH